MLGLFIVPLVAAVSDPSTVRENQIISNGLINGLINNIDAPVVPIHDAIAVPIKRNTVFNVGEPTKVPFNLIPPEIVNNANNSRMNGIYSNKSTWNSSENAVWVPKKYQNGIKKTVAQKAEIFP